MKHEQLSGYAKFILLADQARGISGNLSTYLAYKEVLKILEECSKSDTPSVHWKNELIEKPITRMEAVSILDKLKNNRWDQSLKKIAHVFKIELR